MGKRQFKILAAVLALIILFAGCGGGSGDKSIAPNEQFDAPAEAPQADSIVDENYGMTQELTQTSGGESQVENRKIIKNARLEIEALNATAFYGELASYCNSLGGYEFGYSISNYDDYSVINATLKIPPESLDSLIKFAGEGAKLINSSLSSDDITESFYDAETRLETKRKSLERYYDLLKDAQTIDEIVYIQRIIDGITEEIEALEGRLKMWSDLVSMATVELLIRQESDPVKIKKEISWSAISLSDMGYLISRGFMSLLNGMVSVLQWIIIAAVSASPLLVIGVIAVIVIWRVRKKRRVPVWAEKDREE